MPQTTDPKLKYLQKRLNDTVLIATEKAAAHILSPSAYPLPPANVKSLERALYEVAMALPKRKREDFADKFKASVHATASQRLHKYGDLGSVSLASHKAIHEQVKEAPVPEVMKIKPEDLEKHTDKTIFKKPVLSKNIKPQQAALASNLSFIVDSLTCNKTNDLHKDEINIAAFASDTTGNSFNKAPFFVGKFKKGETLPLGAAGNLFSFPVDGGSAGVFPVTFTAGVFLVEDDVIHNTELGEKLAAVFGIAQVTLLAAVIGVAFIPGVGFPLIFSLLVGAVVSGILSHYVFPALTDDIGGAITDTLTFDAQPGIGETVTKNLPLEIDVSFLGSKRGDYTAAIRWVTS